MVPACPGHARQYSLILELFKKSRAPLGPWRGGAGSARRRGLVRATGRATRTSGTEGRRRPERGNDQSRPAGAELPGPAIRTPRPTGPVHHAVVVMVIAVMVEPDDHGTYEEDGRQDEDDPGDDHHPRRRHIKARWLHSVVLRWRRGRRGCGHGRRLGRRFRCFRHALHIALVARVITGSTARSCCELRPPGAKRRPGARASAGLLFCRKDGLPGSPNP